MIESLGKLAFEVTSESLLTSTILWVVTTLVNQLLQIKDAAWRARIFLLPVLLPVPLVVLIHIVVRPHLLDLRRTPLEDLLISTMGALPHAPVAFLGLAAIALLFGSVRILQPLAALRCRRSGWRRQRHEQSSLWLRCSGVSHSLARAMRVPPARIIMVNDIISGSLALGPLGSYVLVSNSLARRLDDDELESLMAHELGHIRRRDGLEDALANLCRRLLVFSPFAQWAYQSFSQSREEAVDDLAVHASGRPLALASCLVKACRVSQGCAFPTSCHTLLGSANAVERRIRRLLHYPSIAPEPQRRCHVAFFGTIAATVFIFILAL